jgi:hypothetical protein
MKISLVQSWSYPNVISNTTIDELLLEIRNPESMYKDAVLEARYNVERKNDYKAKMPCALPHGVFAYGNDKSVISFSDHLFIDYDYNSTSEAIERRDALISNPLFKATWVSSSGMGVHTLVYCPGLNNFNFKPTMKKLHDTLREQGIPPDNKVMDISRKMVISYDPDLKNNHHNIAFETSGTFIHTVSLPEIKELTLDQINAQSLHGIMQQLKVDFRTPEDFSDGAGYHVYEEGKEIVRIWFKSKVSSGRNNTFVSVTSALLYLNPWLSNYPGRLKATLMAVNNRVCQIPLSWDKISQMVEWAIKRWNEGTLDKPSTETRKIIINRTVYRTTKEAQSVAAKVSGQIRRKNKIRLLQEAYNEYYLQYSLYPTQIQLYAFASMKFKVGIRTIKRYWKDITSCR